MDVLRVDDQLTDDERMIRDTVRAVVADKVDPYIADWFEQGTFPVRELGLELGRLGLLGMHLEGYGCAGMGAVAYGVVCRELEASDSGLRSFVSVQGSLAMTAIHKYGSEEQKQEWLPRMATGEALGCFGLTEPDNGSDPGAMRTNAKRDGGDWVLNGAKMWITNGSVADVAVVWARTDDGIRGFLVPTKTPGFAAPEQYRDPERLGPWTDVYGIGASMFACLAAFAPQAADARLAEDHLVSAKKIWAGAYSDNVLEVIDWCLRLDPLERPQSVFALQKAIRDIAPRKRKLTFLDTIKKRLFSEMT